MADDLSLYWLEQKISKYTPAKCRKRYSDLIANKIVLQRKLSAIDAEMRVLDLRTDLWGGAGPDFHTSAEAAA